MPVDIQYDAPGCSAKASEEVVRVAHASAEKAYQKDAKIAQLETELRSCEQKLHKYQAAAGDLEGQCQDQAAEITDLQQQLDGAFAEEDEVIICRISEKVFANRT